MAVLKNIVLAAALLTPFALAAPMLDERAIYTHTYTEIEWVTVEETTTVWVNPTAPTPPPAPVAPAVTTTTASSVAPAEFAGAPYTPSTFSTVPVAPSAAAPSSAASPTPAPAASPAPSPSAVNVQPKDVTGSASNNCEGEGDACLGDVTHWDGGLGACGWNVNTNSDMQIALPYAFMGTQSNGNPFCGRSVTLYNPTSGTTVQAIVGDKCMGCEGRAIDCTDTLFSAITDGQGDGRVSGIEWWLN